MNTYTHTKTPSERRNRKLLDLFIILVAAAGLGLTGAALSGCEREADDSAVETEWKEAGQELGEAGQRTGEAFEATGERAAQEIGQAGERVEAWGERTELRADQEVGEFRTNLDQELSQLDQEFNEIEAELETADAQARTELQQELNQLEQRKEQLDQRVARLSAAGEAEWEQEKSELYRDWYDLRRDLDATRTRIQ